MSGAPGAAKVALVAIVASLTTALALAAPWRRRSRVPPALKEHADNTLCAELAAAVDLALKGGAKILEAIDDAKSITSKGVADLVTATDKANEDLIFEGLRKAFPGHAFIGEESSADSGVVDALDPTRPTWIVDPIDGTTNFVSGIPFTCVSIGLCVAGRPALGVIYNPCTDELYVGVRGCGSYLNGRRLQCSDVDSMEDAVVIQEYGYEREDGILALMSTSAALLGSQVRALRQFGSGALDLCFVAAGRCDAVYAGVAHEGLCKAWWAWDYCAGLVIAEEAGAQFRTIAGEPFDIFYRKNFVCAAPGVLDELLSVLNSATS